MHFIKHTRLFIANNFKQIRRKWLTLPFLFVYPIVMTALIAIILMTFFTPSKQDPIQVGIVDQDQSQETKMIMKILIDSGQFGELFQMDQMTASDAEQGLVDDQLSAAITFPKNFTSNLYNGVSVELPVVGNPNEPINSRLVKEMVNSAARHIGASQANILTINYYAKQTNMDAETRNDMLFEQFKDFLFYTLSKDEAAIEHELSNAVTASPLHYYVASGWFVITTIWMLLLYNMLYKENTYRMKERMKLYGVNALQQISARIFVTFVCVTILSLLLLFGLQRFLGVPFYLEDCARLGLLVCLYNLSLLVILAIIEVLITSQRFRLLVQFIVAAFLILASGAIVPVLYFPIELQQWLSYIFSYEALHWIQEILLHERLYADYIPLSLMLGVFISILAAASLWKELTQK